MPEQAPYSSIPVAPNLLHYFVPIPLDPVYRRKLNKQRRQTERSYGASLMRLRKQRRLKRSDFGPISSKEIARIERNEIEKPHLKTLEAIACRLGVCPEEIGSY